MAKTANKNLSSSLATVDELTAVYATERQDLRRAVEELNDVIAAAKRKHMPAIRKAVIKTKEAHAKLKASIEAAKPEFEKPKTRIFHGIKVGFRKLIGKLTWTDSEKVVQLIEKHLPDQSDVLIKVTKTPVRDALAQLAAADLKRIGVSVGKDADEVFIKPADSEVDKVVEALLAEEDSNE